MGELVASLTLDQPPQQLPPDDDPLRDPLLPPSQSDNGENQHPGEDPSTGSRMNDPTSSNNHSLRSRRRPLRVLDRDAAFFQSRGRWRVQNLSRGAARVRYECATGRQRRLPFTKRFWDDWFYSLAYQRTIVLMMILFLSYGAIVVLFGFIYLGVSYYGEESKVNPDGSISKLPFCDMDIHDHMEALYFSLSTMTTIGYGVSDYYFGGCWTPLLLVLAQVCCAITFDAVAIGLLFQRVSRGHKRGKTVMFSDRAVIQRVKGRLYLMFRIGELRHHQLHDASVKAYCVRHQRIANSQKIKEKRNDDVDAANPVETTHFVTRPLQFLHEQFGGNSSILMSLPQVIVHRIDEKSPLAQPREWFDVDSIRHRPSHLSEQDDCNGDNGGKNSKGETYKQETIETAAFLEDRQAEIIVLVEGTDELTGAAIQARHSYNAHDLAWNHALAPCIFPYDEARFHRDVSGHSNWCRNRTLPTCLVDFNAFHDLSPVPDNVSASPYVHE